MKKYKVVYKAVRKVILTAHMEDGASMADIVKETDEQKKEGRIRYLVVAEEKRVGQSEQEEQNNVGTRGSRDAGGERSQRVKRGKGEPSTEGQKGEGHRGAGGAGGGCTDRRSVHATWLPDLCKASRGRRF